MITKEIERACMASLDRFMMALNAHDADAMDEEMHFPHVRHAEGRLVVYERPGSNPMDLFNSLIQRSNWDHSTWTKRVPVQSSDTKVHWAVEYCCVNREISGAPFGRTARKPVKVAALKSTKYLSFKSSCKPRRSGPWRCQGRAALSGRTILSLRPCDQFSDQCCP